MADSALNQFEDEVYPSEHSEVNPIAQKTSPIAPNDRVEVKTEDRTYAAVGDSSPTS